MHRDGKLTLEGMLQTIVPFHHSPTRHPRHSQPAAACSYYRRSHPRHACSRSHPQLAPRHSILRPACRRAAMGPHAAGRKELVLSSPCLLPAAAFAVDLGLGEMEQGGRERIS